MKNTAKDIKESAIQAVIHAYIETGRPVKVGVVGAAIGRPASTAARLLNSVFESEGWIRITPVDDDDMEGSRCVTSWAATPGHLCEMLRMMRCAECGA
jgi:hypothetical protein